MEKVPDVKLADKPPQWWLDGEPRDIRDVMREQAEAYRGAALIGHGVILAINKTGEYDQVLDTIGKVLWPQAIDPPA